MSFKTTLKRSLPSLYDRLAYEWHILRAIRALRRHGGGVDTLCDLAENYQGKQPRHCPVCGFTGSFRAFGSPPRYNALCPSCGALERHRLIALALKSEPLPRPGMSVLHFAPERCIRSLFDKPGVSYRTADLQYDDLDLKLNIEAIALPDGSFDVIVCNHVLEHVDDRRAMPELHRVLSPQGVLIATVPIVAGCDATYEDAKLTDAADRRTHFGQWDHVRLYGADFATRLAEAGFTVRAYAAYGAEAVKHALLPGERVFFCRKAQAGA